MTSLFERGYKKVTRAWPVVATQTRIAWPQWGQQKTWCVAPYCSYCLTVGGSYMKPNLLCSDYVFVLRPNYELMRQAYNSYLTQPDYGVCPRLGTHGNHCAVRMSIALVRSGSITFDYFGSNSDHRSNRGHSDRVHHRGTSGSNSCGLDLPHVPGASELAHHIRAIWGTTCQVFRDTSLASASMTGRHGIVYFENCFHRSTDPRGVNRGDHIDLWDGTEFWNIKLGKSAGGGLNSDAPLFDRASQVWFIPL